MVCLIFSLFTGGEKSLELSHQRRMCDRCLAQQGKHAPPAMHYKNFGDHKAWHLTEIHHDGYLELDRHSLSPWLDMPGFKIESMAYDLLHNIWLGTARDLFASGLKTLVMQGCYSFTGLTDLDSILSYVDSKIRKTRKEYKPLTLEIGIFVSW